MDDFTNPPTTETQTGSAPALKQPKGKPKAFQCPACGGSVTIKALGITIHAVCSQCSSVIDVANENYQVIAQANAKIRKTLLEMGSRGTLDGVEWEIVGYMEKTDATNVIYSWDEYLLYNPYQGFRFLVQSEGHWNLMKVLKQDVAGTGFTNEAWLGDQKYRIFFQGESVVRYVKGEFYWRVKVGERTTCVDYVAPPYMLSVERNNEEINAALGTYLTPDAVASAFNIKIGMPYRRGVGANQPAPYQGKFGKIWLVAAGAFAVAFMVQIITSATADNADVYTTQAAITPYQKNQTFSTPPFTLPKEGSLLIKSSSPVKNDWTELDLSLVNEQTNEQYVVQHAIEYYQGIDDDGSWSEGSQYAETLIPKVPSGRYRLLIDADGGALQANMPVQFTLKIKRDVPSWSNFWLALVLLLMYPIFATLRRWSFESKRWAESDYAPVIYRKNQGSDDD